MCRGALNQLPAVQVSTEVDVMVEMTAEDRSFFAASAERRLRALNPDMKGISPLPERGRSAFPLDRPQVIEALGRNSKSIIFL
tara:strand:- start:3289 stop:3537 length:249 start_codon:yes stop_codon:yes gene_type:complete